MRIQYLIAVCKHGRHREHLSILDMLPADTLCDIEPIALPPNGKCKYIQVIASHTQIGY